MNKDKTFKVIDIFAGPGGLGEGFAAYKNGSNISPFNLSLSIEKDPSAHNTLLLRSFFRQFGSDNIPDSYWNYLKGEITKEILFSLHPKQATAAFAEAKCIELGKTPQDAVMELIDQRLKGTKKWVLVGGPPCQAYSLVGRARMKSKDPEFEKDERHFLYREYLRIISNHRPPVFVMENVQGMLSAQHSGERIIQKILDDLQNPDLAIKGKGSGLRYRLFSLVERKPFKNYEPIDFLVHSEKYGIPQARHRVLILGLRKDIDISPETLSKNTGPSVSDVIGDLPRIRSVVSKEPDTLENWKDILQSVTKKRWYIKGRSSGFLKTVEKIDEVLGLIETEKLLAGAEILEYSGAPAAHSKWYRNGCDGLITNHSSRSHMRSDLHRYLFAASYVSANNKSVNLSDFPVDLLPAHRNVQEGIKNNHFGDRFRVQNEGRPSSTITSHISKDGHYFIHYDPSQCRSLTVREAARLQTFPDNYKFEGNRTSQYHQVGNAVPPLLSVQIAEIVYDILKRIRF